jgi:hypothetical protein
MYVKDTFVRSDDIYLDIAKCLHEDGYSIIFNDKVDKNGVINIIMTELTDYLIAKGKNYRFREIEKRLLMI